MTRGKNLKLIGYVLLLCLMVGCFVALGTVDDNSDKQLKSNKQSLTDKPATTCKLDSTRLVGLINEERAHLKRQPLVIEKGLTVSAAQKLNDMVGNKYFGHNLSNGEPWYGLAHAQGIMSEASEEILSNNDTAEKAWFEIKTIKDYYGPLTSQKFTRVGIAASCTNFILEKSTGPGDNRKFIGRTIRDMTVIQIAGPKTAAESATPPAQ